MATTGARLGGALAKGNAQSDASAVGQTESSGRYRFSVEISFPLTMFVFVSVCVCMHMHACVHGMCVGMARFAGGVGGPKLRCERTRRENESAFQRGWLPRMGHAPTRDACIEKTLHCSMVC